MRLHEVFNEKDVKKMHIKQRFAANFSLDMMNDVITVDENEFINVIGGCRLHQNYSKLPVKFNLVSQNFICTNKQLTTLEGCPKEVGQDFDCSRNRLTSLTGSPHIIDRGNFDCSHNQLTSLIGAPTSIPKDFLANENPLVSLEGLPKEIGGHLYIDYTSTLPLLKLCFSKMIDVWLQPSKPSLESDCREIELLMRKYFNTGRKGAIQCAAELSRLGCKGNAKL